MKRRIQRLKFLGNDLIFRLFFKWLAWNRRNCNSTRYSMRELKLAGFFDEDCMYGGMLGEALMKMIYVFSYEGHSGMSAGITCSAFKTLAMFDPLSPLTGEDDEWNECEGGLWQNNRCGHVFKDNGQAYDGEARVFRPPSGVCYTSKDSRVDITFPYTPTREYVEVET